MAFICKNAGECYYEKCSTTKSDKSCDEHSEETNEQSQQCKVTLLELNEE